MGPDWRSLAPHRPLDPGAAGYVSPPDGAGERVAKWISAGGSTVLLGGPVGVGKSTELARATAILQATHVACLVQLDRHVNMRKVTADEARVVIARRVADTALAGRNAFTSELLRQALSAVSSVLTAATAVAGFGVSVPPPKERPPAELLELTLREVGRLAEPHRVCLLIDGVEKCPESVGRDLFDALADIPEDVDIVTTVPWHATFGPASGLVLREGEVLELVRPPLVDGPEGARGRAFLRELLRARLPSVAVPAEVEPLIEEAAHWSGGLPRTFLQILAAAGTFARIRRDADWPDPVDLADAVSAQQESYRRLLLPGDTEAILAAANTDGREMALDRRVRLLSHGLLLERRGPRLEIHPLARDAVQEGVRA